MKSQLLCTFSTKPDVDNLIDIVRNTYTLVYRYIFVLYNEDNDNELFITYNIDISQPYDTALDNTIFVHRKKHTNTLYTINALNQLIRDRNDGVLDKNYMVDWSEYNNCIILVGDESPRIIKTQIYSVIDLESN